MTASATPLTGVIAVSAGQSFSLALQANGTVWAWGDNNNGELGIGNYIEQNYAVQVPGLSNVVAISAGIFYSLALTSDGNVWAWGDNSYGELGDGSYTTHITPEQVPGISGVVALSAMGITSLALTADSAVWVWGDNTWGELGLDSFSCTQSSPTRIPGFYATTLGTDSVGNSVQVLKITPMATFAFNTVAKSVQFINPYDPSATETASGFHYAYDFNNDGTFEVGNGTYAGAVTQNTASITGYLTTPGSYIVHGRIIDNRGGYTDYYTTVTINADRGDWWMFHHDVQHTGCSPFSGPAIPALKWKYTTGAYI